jgi:hypothetical protein
MSNTKSDFVGVWKLELYEMRSSNGEKMYPMGPDAQGYIVYTDEGFMSVAIMKKGRMLFKSNDLTGATTEEKLGAADGYLSYCGLYEVQERQVIHHVKVSLIPNWIAGDQVRFYEFDGDRLTLSAPFLFGGKEQTARLVWRRLQRTS